MEKLSIPGGTYNSHPFNLNDRKRFQKADLQVTKKKNHRQGLQLVCSQREEALRRMEYIIYESWAFLNMYPWLLGQSHNF